MDFPDHKIVQLPQSVWFTSAERAQQANRVLGAHPDFTLLVRDRESEGRAAAQLPDVARRYCWDMALGWTPPSGKLRQRKGGVLVLARTDSEGASGLGNMDVETALGHDVVVADWTSDQVDTLLVAVGAPNPSACRAPAATPRLDGAPSSPARQLHVDQPCEHPWRAKRLRQ